MLELQNEVQEMFSGYGIKFEKPAQEQSLLHDIEDALVLPEAKLSYNDEGFLNLQKVVLEGYPSDQQIAQYTFLNENFSMDPTEYRFGDISPISQEDEKFDPLDKFHVRFGQEDTSTYDGDFQGKGRMNTYETMKFFMSLEDKPYEHKADRVGIKKNLLKRNQKFSLFSTTGSGEVWIPNCMAKDSRWMLDHIDQDMATWALHVKKVKRF